MNIPTAQLRIVALAITAVSILGLIFWQLNQPVNLREIDQPTVKPAIAEIAEFIVVDVQGKVKNPGVYELPLGSRVVDAIAAAGGLRNKVTAGLNQARFVEDGEQLVIGVQPKQASDSKLNINNATAVQLEQLPGIGPVLAERIVRDRDANGRFKTIQDLDRVSGVGDYVMQNVGDLIVCE